MKLFNKIAGFMPRRKIIVKLDGRAIARRTLSIEEVYHRTTRQEVTSDVTNR
jgi:hypothetical protein